METRLQGEHANFRLFSGEVKDVGALNTFPSSDIQFERETQVKDMKE